MTEPPRSRDRSALRRERAPDRRRAGIVLALIAVAAAACTPAGPELADPAAPSPSSPAAAAPSPVREYPDAIERRLNLLAAEDRPVEDSAMPPRHLDEDRFPTSLVERTRIVSGGPPPDGIRSIDDPVFEPVHEVDWLEPDEAVLSLELDGVARAYPVRILMCHETDPRLTPMARVIGVGEGPRAVAVDTVHSREVGVVDLEVQGRPVTVWHVPGLASALDQREVADGRDVGATGAFFVDGPDDPREFQRRGDGFVDTETGSTWNVLGHAVAGPMAGHRLQPAVHLDTFWFAWSSYVPDTRLVSRPDRTG